MACQRVIAALREQFHHVRLYIDVVAATSVCYRKIGAIPIVSAIHCKNLPGADLALMRRTHAEQRGMAAARP